LWISTSPCLRVPSPVVDTLWLTRTGSMLDAHAKLARTSKPSVGRRETSNNAVRRRAHVHDENGRPRYNYRTPYPPRGHPTYLPYPSRLSQLTEPDRIYGTENREKGKRKIGWAQAVYPLRARLQELKETNLHPERWDDTLEDELTRLRSGEQAFMAIRPKLIRAGYTTLDSIPRIQKGSGIRFFCPPLKGVDSKTQESATRWIQMLHKFPAHLHALDIKDAHTQRDPGIQKAGRNENIKTSR